MAALADAEAPSLLSLLPICSTHLLTILDLKQAQAAPTAGLDLQAALTRATQAAFLILDFQPSLLPKVALRALLRALLTVGLEAAGTFSSMQALPTYRMAALADAEAPVLATVAMARTNYRVVAYFIFVRISLFDND